MPPCRRIRLLLVSSAVAFALVAAVALAAIGDLTPQGCIDDADFGADACAATPVEALGGAHSFVVSPSGTSGYAISFFDDAIIRFNRDPNTGALTAVDCIDDNDSRIDTCAQSTDGLEQPRGMAISPDGTSDYVASQIDDSIARFNRAADGSLTPGGCIDDNDTGADACGADADGLDNAVGIAVSADNKTVYVAANSDDALAIFTRDPATGAITPAGCVDDNDTGADACTAEADGLTALSQSRSAPALARCTPRRTPTTRSPCSPATLPAAPSPRWAASRTTTLAPTPARPRSTASPAPPVSG